MTDMSPRLLKDRIAKCREGYEAAYGHPPGDKHAAVIECLAGVALLTPLDIVQCCKNIKK